MTHRITIYDTTLRDGAQGEGVNFSLTDKVRIARKMDEFGMDYIEGGWPGSNPKDIDFFESMKKERLSHSKLCAFGSTRRPHRKASEDDLILQLLKAETPVITIFGKSWDFHVTHALKVSHEENLEMIHDTITFLKSHVDEVIFDVEHFFDGYKHNRNYAMECLKVAGEAGASVLALCDTNGGTLPMEIGAVMEDVIANAPVAIGIHLHNDSGCGVANALIAVDKGAIQVQGTINGYGERCGNASLTSIIANLRLKMGRDCLVHDSLSHLTSLSQYIDETANLAPNTRAPFVGRSAFAHKAGVHVDAVLKHRSTYEHVDPESVGNTRRMLVSELSGGSTIVNKAAKHELDLTKSSPETRMLLKKVADLERHGYSFEGAEASFELLLMETMGTYRKLFDLDGFRVIVEQRSDKTPVTEATVKIKVNGEERLEVAEGDGPVHALDSALRKALLHFYPELANIKLTDFKVRVVDTSDGTAAKVRTIIDSTDGAEVWSTVGVSENMVVASWKALVEGVVYGILRKNIIKTHQTQ